MICDRFSFKMEIMSVLQQLQGRQLGAVTFVQDYLQLHFDGPCINVYSRMTVESGGRHVSTSQDGFRDILCGRIAQIVGSVEITELAMSIGFLDGSRLLISLRDDDRQGPEAVYMHGFDGPSIVI